MSGIGAGGTCREQHIDEMGFEQLLERLREHPAAAGRLVILLRQKLSDDAEARSALRLRADAYNYSELMARIERDDRAFLVFDALLRWIGAEVAQ